MVRASDASFAVRLADGSELPGRLVGRPATALAHLLGRALLVFGTGRFGPAGELLAVEADGFVPNDGGPWVVTKEALPLTPDELEEQGRRIRSVIGKWPGDETDE